MSSREATFARRWFPTRLLAPGDPAAPTAFPWSSLAATLGVALGPALPLLFLFARARWRARLARAAAGRSGGVGAGGAALLRAPAEARTAVAVAPPGGTPLS